MTTEPKILTVDEMTSLACRHEAHGESWPDAEYRFRESDVLAFSEAIEQAVLQSPEVQRLREAQDQRDIAITMLADWCAAIKRNGTGWDDWDEHYKDAAFRPGPLRDLIDAAMEKQP